MPWVLSVCSKSVIFSSTKLHILFIFVCFPYLWNRLRSVSYQLQLYACIVWISFIIGCQWEVKRRFRSDSCWSPRGFSLLNFIAVTPELCTSPSNFCQKKKKKRRKATKNNLTRSRKLILQILDKLSKCEHPHCPSKQRVILVCPATAGL